MGTESCLVCGDVLAVALCGDNLDVVMSNGSTDFSGRFDSGARVFIAGQGSVVELVSRQEVHVCLIVERICDPWSAEQLQGMVLNNRRY